MAITRVTAVWTGWSGAPGYTNIFFSAFGGGDLVDAEVSRVNFALNWISNSLPSSVTIQVQPEVAILDEATGALIQYASAEDTPSPITGGSVEDFSSASGAVVTWNTDTVNRGRRVRGRTFLVPLHADSYDSDGTLSTEALDRLDSMARSMMGDGDGPQLVVWSRPVGGSGGVAAPVTGTRIADRVSILRSRRD